MLRNLFTYAYILPINTRRNAIRQQQRMEVNNFYILHSAEK